MKETGQRINNFLDWKVEMLKLVKKAVSKNRLINAAFYYRAAEFYLLYDDPDKEVLYISSLSFSTRHSKTMILKDLNCHMMKLSCLQ